MCTNTGKPREAVDMYLHNKDWEAAMRVAEQYDPTAITDILLAQACDLAEAGQYQLAEAMYLKAKRPEVALQMYRETKQWPQALRLAEAYLPSKVQEIHLELAANLSAGEKS